MKKIFKIFCLLLIILTFSGCNRRIKNNESNKEEMKIYIKINNKVLSATLENNSSGEAFYKKLEEGNITRNLHDYGNFEKVGDLGFDLPRNDEEITTEAGDIILYLGNQITIYYDTNEWEFTRLGKIDNVDKEELKSILGKENVDVTFSINEE